MNLKKSILIGAVLTILILFVQYSSFATNPSVGFDILIYEPFQFAFSFFVGFVFLFINRSYVVPSLAKIDYGKLTVLIIYAIVFSIVWTVISFLLVLQLHLSLGGKL